MDRVEPRTRGRARPGDPLNIYLGGQLAAQARAAWARWARPPASTSIRRTPAPARPSALPMRRFTKANRSHQRRSRHHAQHIRGAGADRVLGNTQRHRDRRTPVRFGADFRQLANQRWSSRPVPRAPPPGAGLRRHRGGAWMRHSPWICSRPSATSACSQSPPPSSPFRTMTMCPRSPWTPCVAEPPSGSSVARFVAKLSRSHTRTVSFQYATRGWQRPAGRGLRCGQRHAQFRAGRHRKEHRRHHPGRRGDRTGRDLPPAVQQPRQPGAGTDLRQRRHRRPDA